MEEKVVQASGDKQKWDTSLLRVCGYETQNLMCPVCVHASVRLWK